MKVKLLSHGNYGCVKTKIGDIVDAEKLDNGVYLCGIICDYGDGDEPESLAFIADWVSEDISHKKDKIVKRVLKAYKQRSKVGIEKYSTTLERNDLTRLEWLTHLQEELMDATLYIEKLKDEL